MNYGIHYWKLCYSLQNILTLPLYQYGLWFTPLNFTSCWYVWFLLLLYDVMYAQWSIWNCIACMYVCMCGGGCVCAYMGWNVCTESDSLCFLFSYKWKWTLWGKVQNLTAGKCVGLVSTPDTKGFSVVFKTVMWNNPTTVNNSEIYI